MSPSLGLKGSRREVQLLTHENGYGLGRNVGRVSWVIRRV
jgi:hypothetical protein